jgi:hypothetical protein
MLNQQRLSRVILVMSGFVLIALAGLGIFVWPTRYRYDHLGQGKIDVPVRIDRFSGRTEALSAAGWQTLGTSSSEQATQGIPPDSATWRDGIVPGAAGVAEDGSIPEWEIPKITGKCAIVQTDIECEIYNGTNLYRLSEITILVKLRDHDGKIALARSYNLTPASPTSFVGALPLTSSRFSCRLGLTREQGGNWGWEVQKAKGELTSR